MGVKKSAFASRLERTNYYKLKREWGDKFTLYHNLPFLNIFTIDDVPNIELRELNFLKKTSVDFILCNDLDEYILCIDFDGWKEGVNQGVAYQPSLPPENEWRQIITELKLRVAHASNFPYFVFSSSQFDNISSNIPLTLADGIIGDVIANKIKQERYRDFRSANEVKLTKGEESFLDYAKSIGIVDWGLLFQVDSEMNNNPIVKLKWKLWNELGRPQFTPIILGGVSIDKLPDNHPLAKYKLIFPKGIPKGNTVIIETEDCGTIWANISLHNFRTPGYSGFWLGDDIAHLLALDKLYRRRKMHK